MPSISSSPQARRGPSTEEVGQYVSTGYSGDGTTHDQFTGAGSFCILIEGFLLIQMIPYMRTYCTTEHTDALNNYNINIQQ